MKKCDTLLGLFGRVHVHGFGKAVGLKPPHSLEHAATPPQNRGMAVLDDLAIGQNHDPVEVREARAGPAGMIEVVYLYVTDLDRSRDSDGYEIGLFSS